jgi:predicted dinucleotide-binding enzyme
MEPPLGKRLPTLIVGGKGKTGRRVAQRLATRGLPVRIGSRRSFARLTAASGVWSVMALTP